MKSIREIHEEEEREAMLAEAYRRYTQQMDALERDHRRNQRRILIFYIVVESLFFAIVLGALFLLFCYLP